MRVNILLCASLPLSFTQSYKKVPTVAPFYLRNTPPQWSPFPCALPVFYMAGSGVQIPPGWPTGTPRFSRAAKGVAGGFLGFHGGRALYRKAVDTHRARVAGDLGYNSTQELPYATDAERYRKLEQRDFMKDNLPGIGHHSNPRLKYFVRVLCGKSFINDEIHLDLFSPTVGIIVSKLNG